MISEMAMDDGQIWEFYNGLLLSADTDRIRKLLVRYELFKKSLGVPGDVVECGVFKGTGALYWLKLLGIFAPAAQKKVIGFDTFSHFADSSLVDEKSAAQEFTNEAHFEGVDPADISAHAAALGMGDRLELIAGDVVETAAKYAEQNRGFRVSLLHIDIDTYAGTKAILEAFYDRVVPGGIIVCDEYGSPEWGESDAIDEFFSDRQVSIKAVEFSTKPTAYIVKTAR